MNDPQSRQAPPKTSGFGHFLAASRYSFGGLRRIAAESAFRQEVAGFFLLVILFALSSAAALDYAIGTILFLVLIAIEAVNTAIEELVDRVSPERSHMARHAKDLGSFAVACLIGAELVWAGTVLVRLWL